MATVLIADSGSTKCEWYFLHEEKKKKIITTGISPYFLNAVQIEALLRKELLPKVKQEVIDRIFFYGTGLKDNANKRFIGAVLKKIFPQAHTEVETDLFGAARALSQNDK